MPDSRHICSICKRPVNRIFNTASPNVTRGWVHLDRMPADAHEVDPIPAASVSMEEIDQVCDFCSTPEVAWIFPTRDTQRVSAGFILHETAWAACQHCHDLILSDGMTAERLAKAVMKRSVPAKRLPPNFRHFLIPKWVELYEHFINNRDGDPVTFEEWVA